MSFVDKETNFTSCKNTPINSILNKINKKNKNQKSIIVKNEDDIIIETYIYVKNKLV